MQTLLSVMTVKSIHKARIFLLSVTPRLGRLSTFGVKSKSRSARLGITLDFRDASGSLKLRFSL